MVPADLERAVAARSALTTDEAVALALDIAEDGRRLGADRRRLVGEIWPARRDSRTWCQPCRSRGWHAGAGAECRL